MMLPDARFCVECGQPLTDASPGSYSKQLAPKSRPKARGATEQMRSVFQTQEEPPPASMSEALASVTGSAKVVPEPSPFGAGASQPGSPKASKRPTSRSAPPPPPSARKGQQKASPTSSRPKAPAFGDTAPTPSEPPTNEELEMDWADLEQGFDAILSDPGAAEAHSVPSPADVAAVEELFKQIAVTQLGPVRDFMVELDQGTPTKDWLSVCLPAVATLQKSAGKMGVTTITGALDKLHEKLTAAEKSDGSTVGEDDKVAIVQAYNALARELPDVYEASVERDRREPVIVQSLLRQVAGVREVALGKLYAAGLNNLQMFLEARPAEIAETTGLPLGLCQEICARFESYQSKHDSVPPDSKRPQELDQLETLKRELNAANEAFARGKSGWSPEAAADRRSARKQRTETLLRVNLVLARLGAVDLVSQLERLPFERKVAAIDAFLEAARAAQKS